MTEFRSNLNPTLEAALRDLKQQPRAAVNCPPKGAVSPAISLGQDRLQKAPSTPGVGAPDPAESELRTLIQVALTMDSASLATKLAAVAKHCNTTGAALKVGETAGAFAKQAKAAGELNTDVAALDRAAYNGFRRAADLASTKAEGQAVVDAAKAAGRGDAAKYASNKLPELAKRDEATQAIGQAAATEQSRKDFRAANKAAYEALAANDLPEAGRQFQIAAKNATFGQAISIMRAAGDAYRDAKKAGELDADWQGLVTASGEAMNRANELTTTDDQALEIAAYCFDTGSSGLGNYYAKKALELNQQRPRLADDPDNYGVENVLRRGVDAARDGDQQATYHLNMAADMAKNPAMGLEVAHATMLALLATHAEPTPTTGPKLRDQEERIKELEKAVDYAFERAGDRARGYKELSEVYGAANRAGRTEVAARILKKM